MSVPLVRYTWVVEPAADTPLPPGEYRVAVAEGGTYRNLASRRKYTVREIDPVSETIRYEYTRGDGEPVEETGCLTALAVAESVDESPGGLVERPRGRV